MADHNTRCKFTSADGLNRNGRVKPRLGILAERGHAVIMQFQTMFDGVGFLAKSPNNERAWLEAWT